MEMLPRPVVTACFCILLSFKYSVLLRLMNTLDELIVRFALTITRKHHAAVMCRTLSSNSPRGKLALHMPPIPGVTLPHNSSAKSCTMSGQSELPNQQPAYLQ